ncbi:hypothetical protein H8M03_05250 [Sphingomonas sabuli]|uniref:Uncharacterized protein n=1 Tax=Sphingomonas sabuli TaxID=2764186 RepID=A0A7G9L530_9SPHN|nr:hypothetical protein [Sphingomonas sabuli]QNM83729.1 hypothetical protein H8M03_05250 [Sphingomonas sabuli]
MIKSLTAAVALLVATSAAAAPVAAPRTAKGPSAAPQKETVYCLTYEKTTGSRLEKSACKTKREWARERVDVDQLKA